MPMFSRILAPIAFSDRCEGAFQYAEALACHFHSELLLLHVVAPVQSYAFPDAMAVAPELMDEAVAQAKIQLEQFPAGEVKGVPVQREVLEGDPAQEIVQYAVDHQVDLIVMPTHGYGPFRRFLLGSVTAKVLHDAHCPVWTGPHLEGAPPYASISFPNVLCAVDLGPNSRTVLQWASAFAGEYGAKLTVTHAIPGSSISLGGIYFDPEWSARVKKEAQDRALALLQDTGVKADIEIQAGDAPLAVRAVAGQLEASLLVIGRGGEHGLIGRLRANAYGILRESPCPVVAI
jgi:nucleotide-binding universal stress UspA family protein